jgi:hypothetical protein
MRLEEIIEEIAIVVKEKRIAIHSQQYETAARLRDEERSLETKLYDKIFNSDREYDTNGFPIKDTDHSWKDLEDFFKEKFDVEYPLKESDSISVIRQIKLKKLGI